MQSIPQDVISRLHEANEQFHRARRRLDDIDQMTLDQRRETGAALRAAQRELDAATREINAILAGDAAPSSGPAARGN